MVSCVVVILISLAIHEACTQGTCEEFGAVKITGNNNLSHVGRVAVCNGTQWGAICPDNWDTNDAAVVCKELGYTADGAQRYSYNYSGKIVMGNVNCRSTEARLRDCVYSNYSSCTHAHGRGAGVRCRAFKKVNISTDITVTWEYHWHNSSSLQPHSFEVKCFNKQHSKTLTASAETSRISVGDLNPFASYNCCVSVKYYHENYIDETQCTVIGTMDAFTRAAKTEMFSQTKSSSKMEKLIGGVLGFIIAVLLLILVVCGGVLLYLLRSKGMIPKRSTSSQPESTGIPIGRNISYAMAPSTSGAQAMDTIIDQTGAAEYSRIGPSYEMVATANSSHSRRQQPVPVGTNQHSARLSERYEFSEPHLAMISAGAAGSGGTQGEGAVRPVDYEVWLQSGEHEEYSHLQH